ncbi:MAG: Lrp/AsnC family transcriptional regulator [Nanoarchaeota archaeon]
MDTKEEKILKELKEDSRQPIKNISKKTGIKPSTVYKVINRLKDSNTIEKFTIKTNDKKLNKNFIVYMLVLTSKDIPKNFFDNKYIAEVYGITGEYDLLMKLKLPDVDEFNKFVINFRKYKFITKTHTLVATTKIKEE